VKLGKEFRPDMPKPYPPNIIKQLPDAINRRISDISWDKAEWNKAIPIYEKALKSSGYAETLPAKNNQTTTRRHQP
jgi:hypothetical protein